VIWQSFYLAVVLVVMFSTGKSKNIATVIFCLHADAEQTPSVRRDRPMKGRGFSPSWAFYRLCREPEGSGTAYQVCKEERALEAPSSYSRISSWI
jgi:hypothetical protein